MIQKLEQYWLYISIALLLIVFLSLSIWSEITQPLVWIFIVSGTAVAMVFAVHRDFQSYRQGRTDRKGLVRNTVVDVLEILFTILAAVWIAGKAGECIGRMVGKTVETSWPGMGAMAGILAGLSIGVFTGLCVSLVVHWLWGKVRGLKR